MTPEGWADVVLIVLLAAGGLAGWRRGGFRLAGSVAGAVVGLAIGLAVVPSLAARLDGGAAAVATVLGVLLAVLGGAGIGRWVGALPAGLLARLHLGALDRAAGAVAGSMVAFVLVGMALTVLPGAARGSAEVGHWLAVARGSTLGSAATQTAGDALQVVPVRLPAGTSAS